MFKKIFIDIFLFQFEDTAKALQLISSSNVTDVGVVSIKSTKLRFKYFPIFQIFRNYSIIRILYFDHIYFQKNPYSWIPMSSLMLLALITHTGIRLLPWILIGEVSI